MAPRADPVTVVEPRRQLPAAPAPATAPHLRSHVHPQTRPALADHLHRHDHDLTAEPEDRAKYLADAHAAPSTLPFLDSSEVSRGSYEAGSVPHADHPRQRQLSP